jgi:hypothetical protein
MRMSAWGVTLTISAFVALGGCAQVPPHVVGAKTAGRRRKFADHRLVALGLAGASTQRC